MTAAVLVLDHVARRYGATDAVADVTATVGEGEIVALAGHSGSGKSTLLRLVAGLDRPTGGTIAIGGHMMSGPGLFVPPEARGVGLVFQDYALFPHLTVLDNLRFGLARLPRAEAKARALAALDRIGLAGRGGDHPHMLSGGEQQRVALARALLPAPRLLLMDEPFSNLDARMRDRIRDDTAATLRAAGTTAILVTHDPDDAMRVADRILLMERGRIVAGGATEALCRHPPALVVARFVGRFNEIAGRVAAGALATPLGAFSATGIAEGAAAVACVRPGAIRLDGAGDAEVAARAPSRDGVVLTIGLPGLPRGLEVDAPQDTTITAGDRVRLTVSPRDVLVFPLP